MTTAPTGDSDPAGQSDAKLITAVRNGTIAAYGTLYERHVAAAYNLARQVSRSPAEADDLVAEAFAKVLDTLRAGKGPDSAFRAYLLTALRHTAYDKTRKDKRIDLNEDMSEVTGALGGALTVPFSDTAVAGLERTMAARAFAKLPERWQAVLWHTEIEQQSPAEVAPLLGLTPNGVSALAYRAREGLRQAYLQVHLAETTADRCRATADKLGAWTRDGLSKRERTQVETHLDECDSCRALAAELADVNGAIRAVIGPLVLGGAVLGYLATTGAGKASAATAGVAAAAAGSSAGGAAAAGAAAPRQLMGVGASGAAVVAAIAVALASGGPEPVPAAQPQPQPPAAVAPANPAPPAPAPNDPPPAQQPPPPPAQPQDQPAADPPQAPQPEPPPAELPLPADINVTPPGGGVELTPGGGPVDLPITVRNTGESKSDPVLVTLNLPQGVRAVDQAGGGGTTMSAAAPRAAVRGGQTVKCPGGEGKVSCRTPDGLEPDESATLLFRLVADESARPGQITGTVSSGSGTTLKIRVPVRVELKDGVDLRVHGRTWHLSIFVRNTGETTKPATVTIDKPLMFDHDHTYNFDCTSGAESTTCTSNEELEPGDREHFTVVVANWGHHDDVLVTARIGSDSMSKKVKPWCFIACLPGIVPEPPDPTDPTTEPPEPSEPSDEPSEPVLPHDPPESGPPSSDPPSLDDLPSIDDLLPGVSPSSTTTTTTTTTTTSKRPTWERPDPKPRGVEQLLERLLRG